jgi:hypothetical protein
MPKRPPIFPRHRPLGVLHCALTGSVVLGVLFLLSWATSAIADIPASNRLLGLFTQSSLHAPPTALAEGMASALVIGGVAGAVLAIAYNLLAVFSRR